MSQEKQGEAGNWLSINSAEHSAPTHATDFVVTRVGTTFILNFFFVDPLFLQNRSSQDQVPAVPVGKISLTPDKLAEMAGACTLALQRLQREFESRTQEPQPEQGKQPHE